MRTHPAWAQLNFEAKQAWSDIFPDGNAPIKPIPAQKIAFDRYSDPESVFTVDWEALTSWQKKRLLAKLGPSRINPLCIGRTNFRVAGLKHTIFWNTLGGSR
jgi:hypothetical protein